MSLQDEVARCLDALNRGGPDAFLHVVPQWAGRGQRSGLDLAGRIVRVMSFREGRIATIVHLGTCGDEVSCH